MGMYGFDERCSKQWAESVPSVNTNSVGTLQKLTEKSVGAL